MKIFNINSGMTIYEAMQLKISLQKELAKTDQLAVDLTDVSEIDTTGLQLLLALKREKSVTFINPSHCIKELAELLQLHRELGLGAQS
jgi:anti-sigma B factor antagonist